MVVYFLCLVPGSRKRRGFSIQIEIDFDFV